MPQRVSRTPARGRTFGGDALIQPLIDALSANVAILRLDASICAVNAAWRAFADRHACRSDAYCLGLNYLDICRQAEPDCPEAKLTAAAIRAVISGKAESSHHSYSLGLEDGIHHFKLAISRLRLAQGDFVAVCHEDVTAVVRLQERQRSRAIELIEAQDQERRNIARELHDSTAQHLTAMALLAEIMLEKQRGTDMTPVLRELVEIVSQAQGEIRTFSYLLHPPLLDQIGLREALQRYIEGFARRTGIRVTFHWRLEFNEALVDLQGAILRITQEALTNVYRHAGATSASVLIEADADELRLIVEDKGIGIANASGSEGVGIPSMRSRVADCGGTLRIENSGGTRLTAAFRLNNTG